MYVMSIAQTSFGLRDVPMPEEVRIHRMRTMPATGAGLGADRRDAHVLHQGADAPSPDAGKFGAQQAAQHPRPGEGKVQVQAHRSGA
jgi:hypothetical protein